MGQPPPPPMFRPGGPAYALAPQYLNPKSFFYQLSSTRQLAPLINVTGSPNIFGTIVIVFFLFLFACQEILDQNTILPGVGPPKIEKLTVSRLGHCFLAL